MEEKPMRLQDKVAIVTGAGSGIGLATTLLFAREGARLVLNDIDQQGLETVLTDLGKEKGRAVVGDVAQEETSRCLAQEAVSAFRHIDVLVNNAGVFFDKDITDMTVEEWDRLMDVNLKSMFLCCKHVIPHMLRQKKGAIVNLALDKLLHRHGAGGRKHVRLLYHQGRSSPAHQVVDHAICRRGYSCQLRLCGIHRNQCEQTPRHTRVGG